MGPVKLIERAAGTAFHAVRHPVSSTAYAAGIARGLAGAVLHGVTAPGHDSDAGAGPTPRGATSTGTPTATSTAPTGTDGTAATTAATTAGPPEPQRVMKPVPEPGDLPEPIVIAPTDEEPGESFTTEPKAVSRDSAHGGTDLRDAEIDDWEEEAQDGLDSAPDVDVETPVGTTGAGTVYNPDTAPLLDPSVAKAIRSESEILRKAAETGDQA